MKKKCNSGATIIRLFSPQTLRRCPLSNKDHLSFVLEKEGKTKTAWSSCASVVDEAMSFPDIGDVELRKVGI